MTLWTSARVAEALGVRAPGKLTFGTVATDTRDLTPDALFVALQGERFDAHAFLAQARAKGAAAAVVRRGTPAPAMAWNRCPTRHGICELHINY